MKIDHSLSLYMKRLNVSTSEEWITKAQMRAVTKNKNEILRRSTILEEFFSEDRNDYEEGILDQLYILGQISIEEFGLIRKLIFEEIKSNL